MAIAITDAPSPNNNNGGGNTSEGAGTGTLAASGRSGGGGGALRTQLAVRTALCGLMCCMSELQETHVQMLHAATRSGLLMAVGVDGDSVLPPAEKARSLDAGLAEWETFVLGVLRNILLVDRSTATRSALRPFLPWLMDCLTVSGESEPESDDAAEASTVQMKLQELRQQALAAGVPPEDIEGFGRKTMTPQVRARARERATGAAVCTSAAASAVDL